MFREAYHTLLHFRQFFVIICHRISWISIWNTSGPMFQLEDYLRKIHTYERVDWCHQIGESTQKSWTCTRTWEQEWLLHSNITSLKFSSRKCLTVLGDWSDWFIWHGCCVTEGYLVSRLCVEDPVFRYTMWLAARTLGRCFGRHVADFQRGALSSLSLHLQYAASYLNDPPSPWTRCTSWRSYFLT